MSLEYFQILFHDRPNLTFFCGETVSGHVALKLKKEIRLKGLEIKFTGKAEALWRESSYNVFWGTTTTTYIAYEYYVNHSIFALGGKDDDITLPPGEYTYNFSLTLPQESPSSFESKHGQVRYTIKAKIIRPWRSNYEVKVAYTVINVMDLNSLDYVQTPLTAANEKTLCCWCCKSGPVTLAARLPFTGFVPGQRVQVLLEVDNNSTCELTAKCILVQKIVYACTPTNVTCCTSSETKTKEKEKLVETEELGTVDKLGSKNFHSSMVIPSLPASFLNPCKCIYVTYFLRFVVDILGFHLPATLDVPIVIGTIPLRDHFQSILATDMQATSSLPASEDYPNPSALQGANYPGLPSPLYEECVSGATDIRTDEDSKDMQGSTQFTPRYPMYRFQ